MLRLNAWPISLCARHRLKHLAKFSPSNSFSTALVDVLGTTEQPITQILAFGDTSFQVGDALVRQSVILFPSNFLLWNARSFTDITIDSLSMFPVLFPTLEILFIGCGETVPSRLPFEVTDYFRKRGIVVEATNTANAASTFNILNGEGRNVAAALLTLQPTNVVPDIE